MILKNISYPIFIATLILSFHCYAENSSEKTVKAVSKIEFNLIDAVLKNLNIKRDDCKTDLIVFKENPSNTKETIVVIPEIVDEDEQYFELNSYILIVNSKTGRITHKYFESAKTNGWQSDAIILSEITIDTTPYFVSKNTRAFGIRVFYYGMSQANPYSNKTISLFVKSGNTLKRVLRHYNVMDYWGQWDTNCAGESTEVNNTLIISKKKTNGYFDILVKRKITETKSFIDKSGDCDDIEKINTKQTSLSFNGKEYKENNCDFFPLNVYPFDANPNEINKGTNIRQEPNGKIILNLNKQDDYFHLTITEARNEWYKVIKVEGMEYNQITIPGGSGWIHSSVIEVSTRKRVKLLDIPKTGKIVGYIDVETGVRIKDKCAGWVKIEYNKLSGWVDAKWLCGSPVTTCP